MNATKDRKPDPLIPPDELTDGRSIPPSPPQKPQIRGKARRQLIASKQPSQSREYRLIPLVE